MKALIIIVGATALCITSGSISAGEIQSSPLVELKEAISAKDKDKLPPVLEVADGFQRRLKDESLEPAPELVTKIRACEDILGYLANELLHGNRAVNAPEAEAVMASICLFLGKVDALLVEGYQRQSVTSNVSPPPETPNAAAGMNPDAIQDARLRQRYLESIRQNQARGLKNNQQADLASARESVVFLAGCIVRWAEPKGAPRDELLDKLAPPGKCRSLLQEKLKTPVKAPETQ